MVSTYKSTSNWLTKNKIWFAQQIKHRTHSLFSHLHEWVLIYWWIKFSVKTSVTFHYTHRKHVYLSFPTNTSFTLNTLFTKHFANYTKFFSHNKFHIPSHWFSTQNTGNLRRALLLAWTPESFWFLFNRFLFTPENK